MDSKTQIILAVIALLTAIVGASFLTIKIRKKRSTQSTQKDIVIRGNKNKVIGGDDNSTS
jgi:hypothetical protein